ncbi:hypothetical protein C8T65DRAFT_97370 [Cerioporus squamosus]|nr:hypothetical protein C8T65DRAFT_97370 [Cerioporus squamosus]
MEELLPLRWSGLVAALRARSGCAQFHRPNTARSRRTSAPRKRTGMPRRSAVELTQMRSRTPNCPGNVRPSRSSGRQFRPV